MRVIGCYNSTFLFVRVLPYNCGLLPYALQSNPHFLDLFVLSNFKRALNYRLFHLSRNLFDFGNIKILHG